MDVNDIYEQIGASIKGANDGAYTHPAAGDVLTWVRTVRATRLVKQYEQVDKSRNGVLAIGDSHYFIQPAGVEHCLVITMFRGLVMSNGHQFSVDQLTVISDFLRSLNWAIVVRDIKDQRKKRYGELETM